MSTTSEDNAGAPEEREGEAGRPAPERAKSPPSGLAFRRERAIAILSEGFARNLLQIEEFERRVADAHGARSLAELDRLLDDIPEEFHALSLRSGATPGQDRPGRGGPGEGRREDRELDAEEQGVHGVMATRTLRGDWLKSRSVAVRTVMSSTELDFREVAMPPGEVEIRLACVMSSVIVTVPEDLPVQVDVVPVLGEVKEGRRVLPPPSKRERAVSGRGSLPMLRVTGVAVMSEIKIRAR